jgi:hypothetical protein
MNMSRFTNIQLEFTTITPPADPYAQVLTICDPNTGDIIGINKPTWRIYGYNYNLYVIINTGKECQRFSRRRG